MYLRCPECVETSWTEVIHATGLRSDITCESCLRTHAVAPIEGVEPTVKEHYRRTLEISNAKGIDMPGAYAVLLGIMSLARAQRLQKEHEASETPVEASREAVFTEIDPEFQRAVTRGRMTVRDVAQRGDREALVSGPMGRHHLTRELASLVADNKISVSGAISRMTVVEAPAPVRPQASGRQKSAIFCIAVVALGALVVVTWRSQFPPTAHTELGVRPVVSAATTIRDTEPTADVKPVALTRTRTDDAGRVVEVTGPSPVSVLEAYCEVASTNVALEPVEVADSTNRADESRLGIFRDPLDLETLHVIRIRRDRRTRRWVAGRGEAPIRVSPMGRPVVTTPATAAVGG